MSEEERHRLDARARRFCALLDSLLRDFQGSRRRVRRAGRSEGRRAPPRGTARPRACSRTSCTSLAPAAARLTLRARRTRRDTPPRRRRPERPAEDGASPRRGYPLPRRPARARTHPPALRAARNMGALDPTGVGAMMVGIDAADASVSAALEAMAPAAAYAAWQLKNTRVGPAARTRNVQTNASAPTGRSDGGVGGGPRRGADGGRRVGEVRVGVTRESPRVDGGGAEDARANRRDDGGDGSVRRRRHAAAPRARR